MLVMRGGGSTIIRQYEESDMGFTQCMAPQPPEETHRFEPIHGSFGFNAMSKDGEFLSVMFAPSSLAEPAKLTGKWFWVDSGQLTTPNGETDNERLLG